MPYFIYKIHAGKKLECVDAYEKFRDAQQHAKGMRVALKREDDYRVKVMFAKTQIEAEMLLKEEREPRPMGDD
jgi:hypothetical protein